MFLINLWATFAVRCVAAVAAARSQALLASASSTTRSAEALPTRRKRVNRLVGGASGHCSGDASGSSVCAITVRLNSVDRNIAPLFSLKLCSSPRRYAFCRTGTNPSTLIASRWSCPECRRRPLHSDCTFFNF